MNRILQIILCTYAATQVRGQAKLEIYPLTENFYVYTTYNNFQGKPYPANGMYALTEAGAVIFDSPWDTTQFRPLIDSIARRHQKRVLMCIATHSHEDRTAGLEYFRQMKIGTYTTQRTYDISKRTGKKLAEHIIMENNTLSVGGLTMEVIYPGHGHTEDNILIWFPRQKILYGGCYVKSTETSDLGYIEEANLSSWEQGIKAIIARFGKARFVISGHENWRDAGSLGHTLRLLQDYLKKTKQ